MNIERLKKQLIEDEGIKMQIYLDSLGNPTFGIGHLLTRNDVEYSAYKRLPKGGKLTIQRERVDEVFEKDLANACNNCGKIFPNFSKLDDEVQEIIANMMFNLGLAGLKSLISFVDAINSGNYKLAAQRMRGFLWYKQVGKRAERLAARMEKYADQKLCSV